MECTDVCKKKKKTKIPHITQDHTSLELSLISFFSHLQNHLTDLNHAPLFKNEPVVLSVDVSQNSMLLNLIGVFPKC